MKYIEKQDNFEKEYEVTFNIEELLRIENELKNLTYVKYGEGNLYGNKHRKNTVYKMISSCSSINKANNEILNIKYNDSHYEYSYKADMYTQLHYYINTILYNLLYIDKYSYSINRRINNSKVIYNLINYEISEEQIDVENFDFDKLLNLYYETMNSINFELVSVKEIYNIKEEKRLAKFKKR